MTRRRGWVTTAAIAGLAAGCTSTVSGPPAPAADTVIAVPDPAHTGEPTTVLGEITTAHGHPGCVLLRLPEQTWLLSGAPAQDLDLDAAAGRAPPPTRYMVSGFAGRAQDTTTVCGPYLTFVTTSIKPIE